MHHTRYPGCWRGPHRRYRRGGRHDDVQDVDSLFLQNFYHLTLARKAEVEVPIGLRQKEGTETVDLHTFPLVVCAVLRGAPGDKYLGVSTAFEDARESPCRLRGTRHKFCNAVAYERNA